MFDPAHDEKLSNSDTWSWQRRLFANLLYIPLGVCFAVGAAGILRTATKLSDEVSGALAIVAGVCFALICALIFRPWQSAVSAPAKFTVDRIDKLQRGRREQMWTFVLTSPLLVWPLSSSAERYLNHTSDLSLPLIWIALGGVVIQMIGVIMALIGVGYSRPFRIVMNDELSSAQRGRAMRSGFLALTVGCGAIFVAGLIEPRWSVLLLPCVLIGSVDVAAIHFVWLDRQTDVVT